MEDGKFRKDSIEMGLASTSLSYRFRLRSATVFDFAQLPFSTSLSYRFRLRSATVFDFAQLLFLASLSFRGRSLEK
ncbi:hypothetical protein [Emticicia oligotrophica]|uniref:hypothetical protein n=1 Tax=Emticicia oligotrophica TaxID=312279 RepID=UPI00273AA6A9|nr:hypothetical protein [Emticicia oligotrophica]